MSPLKLLLDAARTGAARRPGLGASAALAFPLAAAALTLFGAVILPAEMPRGPEENPGGAVLELVFWLTCLFSAIQSFRLMESLFRTGDARVIAPLPIPTRSLFAYRLLRALVEVALLGAAGAALFAPILWRGDGGLYGACLGLWAGGMLITLCVGFAVQLYAGVSSLEGEAQFDMHGPTGFIVAPGVALAISVILILFAKLTAEELLKGGLGAGGARFGLMLTGGASAACLLLAARYFTTHFYAIFARFLEADLFVLDIGHPYFKEGHKPKGPVERRIDPALVPLYRKDRLQYRRRHTLGRILLVLAAVGLLIGLLAKGSATVPLPLLITLPLLLIALFTNPWRHLWGADLEPGMGEALPIPVAERDRARRIVALLEVAGQAAAPALCVAIGVGTDTLGWGYGAAAGVIAFALPLCAHPLFSVLASRAASSAPLTLGIALVTGVAGAVSAFSIFIAIPVSLAFLAAGVLATSRSTTP